ncbi:winged helix-turn-helix domain-containing protein [Micromonospora sp. NPDC000018]|uniref:AfsR/SARP family transcriptional regulator n=1 Tax=Micromonospora sp. NPDC000018 TaxID=3154239 RepID=UPI00331C6D0C
MSDVEPVIGGTGLAVRVLGPLETSVGGRPVTLTSPRLRSLLVLLALSAGAPVSTDRLAAASWNEDLPEHARRAAQVYVTRLRAALGADLIRTVPGGYLLVAAPEQVDAIRFGRLLDAAAAVPDTVVERARLDEALALWRGAPFDGMRSAWLATVVAPGLVERYLTAVERRVELDLAQGRGPAGAGRRGGVRAAPGRVGRVAGAVASGGGRGRVADVGQRCEAPDLRGRGLRHVQGNSAHVVGTDSLICLGLVAQLGSVGAIP